MSRVKYLVFSPLNHSQPRIYKTLKTAQKSIAQSPQLQMIKFINQSRVRTCLQERKFEYKWRKYKMRFEFKRSWKRSNLCFYQHEDGTINQTELDKVQKEMSKREQPQVVKVQGYLAKDEDYGKAYESCKELMMSYPIQLEGYQAARMLSSFYTKQICPQSQYHGYLNVCSTNHHSYFTHKKSFGYLIARNEEVVLEKSQMVENLFDDQQVWLKGLNFLLMDSFVNQIKRVFIRSNSRVLKNIWNDVIRNQMPQMMCKNQASNSQQRDSTYETIKKTQTLFATTKNQIKEDQNQKISVIEVNKPQEEESNDDKSVTESQSSQSQSESSPQSQSQSQSQQEENQSQSEENESQSDENQSQSDEKKTESESQSQQSQSEEKQIETEQKQCEEKEERKANDKKDVPSANAKQNKADRLTSWNPKYLKDVKLTDKKQELEYYNYKQNGYYKKDIQLLTLLVSKFDYVRLKWCEQKQNKVASQLAHNILNHQKAENKVKNKERRLKEEQQKKEKKRLQEEEKKRKQDEEIKRKLMAKYRSTGWRSY